MKVKIKLLHIDGKTLEIETELNDALRGAAIITRNGRYYVYHRTSGAAYNVVEYQEVTQPLQVDF